MDASNGIRGSEASSTSLFHSRSSILSFTSFCQCFKIAPLVALAKAFNMMGSVSGFSFAPGPVILDSRVATKRDDS